MDGRKYDQQVGGEQADYEEPEKTHFCLSERYLKNFRHPGKNARPGVPGGNWRNLNCQNQWRIWNLVNFLAISFFCFAVLCLYSWSHPLSSLGLISSTSQTQWKLPGWFS